MFVRENHAYGLDCNGRAGAVPMLHTDLSLPVCRINRCLGSLALEEGKTMQYQRHARDHIPSALLSMI